MDRFKVKTVVPRSSLSLENCQVPGFSRVLVRRPVLTQKVELQLFFTARTFTAGKISGLKFLKPENFAAEIFLAAKFWD